jgi:hypothetical protein
MINQKLCPYCSTPAADRCSHLALAAEARDFVRQCVELCQGQKQWRTLCQQHREQLRRTGEWSPEKEDFTWLETAFRDAFLKRLAWFGGMDHEWRSGPKAAQGGFWVLLWSKEPQRLWWELLDAFERYGGKPAGRKAGLGSRRATASAKREAPRQNEFRAF